MKLEKNNIIELQITDMTFEGLGVARYSDENISDFVIFVHNAVVGDIIDCRIVKVLTRYAYGIIENIISPSPDRIVPLCSSFPKCGGCTYLNIGYETELKYKYKLICEAFKKNCPSCDKSPLDIVPSPKIQNYRNKIQYPVSQLKKFGFYARHSHRNVVVENCQLQDSDFEPIIKAAEKYLNMFEVSVYDEKTGLGLIRHLYLRKAPQTGEIMVCFVINGKTIPHKEQFTTMISEFPNVKSIYLNINMRHDNVIMGRESILLWGEETITDELCGLEFKISPLSFYQVNTYQVQQIYDFIANECGLSENDTVLDLYCGIGTISLAIASKVEKVIGVEIIDEAIKNACDNAMINKIKNVEFIASDVGDLEDIIKTAQKFPYPDAIIVDPPRKGLSEHALTAVKKLSPKKIIYISCNPATQARDIQSLNKEKKLYNVEKIVPFDMFPRTGHVESVALLTLCEDEANIEE